MMYNDKLWIVFLTVVSLSPVIVFSKYESRVRRSEDFVPCDKGWFLYRNKCFKLFGKKEADRANWNDAQARCKNLGGNLATIQSQEDNDFLATFMLLDADLWLWMGLHDQNVEGEYQWADGSIVNYTNWRPGAPHPNEDEDCGEMTFIPEEYPIGQWNNAGCGHSFPYICQKDTDNTKRSANPQYCSYENGGGWKFKDFCYHLALETKTWDEAEEHCKQNFNGHLVTISDVTTEFYLNHVLRNINRGVWIGIKLKRGVQQQWSSGWYVGYRGIDIHRDDFREDSCVLRQTSGAYTVIPCSERYSFICEVSKVQPPVVEPAPKGFRCPESPNDWRDLGGEFCYFFETKREVNWFEANFICIKRGGNLASIHSKEEADTLQQFIKYTQHRVHVGFHRNLTQENVFVWTDNSPMDYTNWRLGEPNGLHEKCGIVWNRDMQWNDEKCWSNFGFICSVRKVPLKREENTTTGSDDSTSNNCHVEIRNDSGALLIGVCACAALVFLLLVVLTYCIWSRKVEKRKASTAMSLAVTFARNACDTPQSSRVYDGVKDPDAAYEPMY